MKLFRFTNMIQCWIILIITLEYIFFFEHLADFILFFFFL